MVLMHLKEIQTYLSTKISPKIFRLNSDTQGIQYGKFKDNKLIKKVLLTIHISLEAIHFALKNKVNLIIAHHSLINKPIKKFNQTLINKLTLLSKWPISIYVLSPSLIAAEGGLTDTLVNALHFKVDGLFEVKNREGMKIPIGRICSPLKYLDNKKPIILKDVIHRIKTNLNLEYVSYIGDLGTIIKKACIIGGDNSNMNFIKRAVNKGCDCYISGKINYIEASFARDIGVNLIEISPYTTEIIAIKKLCNILSLEFPYVVFLLFESKDPIKTYF